MISSSVVYGHPVKYFYEIPHEYLAGSGNRSYMLRYFRAALLLEKLLLRTLSE